jgi:hypothetical protein
MVMVMVMVVMAPPMMVVMMSAPPVMMMVMMMVLCELHTRLRLRSATLVVGLQCGHSVRHWLQ